MPCLCGSLEEVLRQHLKRLGTLNLPSPRLVEVPVYCGEKSGPHLNELAVTRQIRRQFAHLQAKAPEISSYRLD